MFRLSAMIVAAALLVGCGMVQKGETMVKYTAGEPVRMSEAPFDGRYALFASTDVRNPQVQYELSRGDKLGFTTRNGTVYGVAGSNETRIETGEITRSYYWRKIN